MMAAHLLLSLLPCAWAELHHLFVGGFGNNVLHSVEFDDQALTLKSSIASSGHGAHPWIAFDVRFPPTLQFTMNGSTHRV
jgi:hypothetical protein